MLGTLTKKKGIVGRKRKVTIREICFELISGSLILNHAVATFKILDFIDTAFHRAILFWLGCLMCSLKARLRCKN